MEDTPSIEDLEAQLKEALDNETAASIEPTTLILVAQAVLRLIQMFRGQAES